MVAIGNCMRTQNEEQEAWHEAGEGLLEWQTCPECVIYETESSLVILSFKYQSFKNSQYQNCVVKTVVSYICIYI